MCNIHIEMFFFYSKCRLRFESLLEVTTWSVLNVCVRDAFNIFRCVEIRRNQCCYGRTCIVSVANDLGWWLWVAVYLCWLLSALVADFGSIFISWLNLHGLTTVILNRGCWILGNRSFWLKYTLLIIFNYYYYLMILKMMSLFYSPFAANLSILWLYFLQIIFARICIYHWYLWSLHNSNSSFVARCFQYTNAFRKFRNGFSACYN